MSTIINSSTVSSASIEEILPSYMITFNVDGAEHIVTDKDLNSEESANGYAIAMFLSEGMDNQKVTFQTYSRGLNINDIISIYLPEYKIPIDLTKNKFIIREINTSYVGAKTLDTIVGVRYD